VVWHVSPVADLGKTNETTHSLKGKAEHNLTDTILLVQ
jgi:hypothetical protein